MQLQQLCTSSHLTAYYDSANDWLFVDWTGHLTLAGVKQDCRELAHCYQHRTYARVLNCNQHVTGADWDVSVWLGRQVLNHLPQMGVRQFAWVCAPTLRGLDMALEAVSWVSSPSIALFRDLDEAVAWLQHPLLEMAPGGCQPPAKYELLGHKSSLPVPAAIALPALKWLKNR